MIAGMNLLLIDDDELDRIALIRSLKHSAIATDIVQCASASEGLALAAARHFDAILLDYRLPEQDGIEVLHKLRSGRFESVPVVMLSRMEDEAIADRCLEAGAQDFLIKDEVTGHRLARAVRQARQRYLLEEDLKRSHVQLRVLSERDPLTGLLNRRGFEIALGSAIARAQRANSGLGLLLLDLDDFKSVNDTLGHDAGDELLVEIARRLRTTAREGDLVCRLGGDEFVVLVSNLTQQDQALLLADRIVAELQKPIVAGSVEQIITTSIGIATLSDCADDAAELLKCADVAMYRAKQDGRNQSRFYSAALQEAVRHRANMKRDLRKALERGEFRVYYQPQIKVADGSLCGIEALVRWHHPEGEVLMPGSFVSLAEEIGLIGDLGRWVLRESCSQLSDWRYRMPLSSRHLTMAVNLSAVQLREQQLINTVKDTLAEYRIDANSLELEITESALIKNPDNIVHILSSLANTGVTISLDDFGTGYSSLQHLQLFPVGVLKIDKEFISTIGCNAGGDRLLVAMIRFAQALELKVVAEGVETKAQADFCRRNGCHSIQGYYYSRPVPAEQFESAFLPSLHDGLSCKKANNEPLAPSDVPSGRPSSEYC